MGGVSAMMVAPFAAPFGAVYGALIGLVLAPALVAALMRKSELVGGALIFGPATLVGVLAGIASQPLWSMFLAAEVYMSMAAVAWLVLPDTYPRKHRSECGACGYSIQGLARCPECGRAVNERQGGISQAGARGRRLTACVVVALGVLLPLSFGTGLVVKRYKPRTTEEWIEQMGDNDMQLQWEARHALVAQGREPLLRALGHKYGGVRANAAWALEELRDPSTREALQRTARDPDPYVRKHVQDALDALGPANASSQPEAAGSR